MRRPVIAAAAREQGILTIGVVTKPFHFEGRRRMQSAEQGITELEKVVDTLIVIPNQNLFKIANEKTTFADAFKMADDVLHMGVRGVTDLMVMPGLINLDFADIRTVMGEMGKAMMGTGEAEGQDRSRVAAESAISNPLLEDHSMKGAKGVLINITGGLDMTLHEVDEAANRIREEVDADANIIFGSTFDATMQGRMRVSVVATGIAAMAAQQPAPNYLSLDMNRPMQTGQPALSRPVAPPVGRVAMPAAAVAPLPAPMAPRPSRRPWHRSQRRRRRRWCAAAGARTDVRRCPGRMPIPAPIVAHGAGARAGRRSADRGAGHDGGAGRGARCTAAGARAGGAAGAARRRARTGSGRCAPAAAGRRERLARQPSGRQAAGAGQRARCATGCRAAGWREPRAQPVPAHHRRLRRPQAATAPPRRPPAAEPPAARPVPENVVAVAPKPAARPAPAQASINLDVTERAKPARDDDDLQIPAFLRRQAN